MKNQRTPVSSEKTGCLPFNRSQKAAQGYKVGENPVKENGKYVESYDEALEMMRGMKCASWRNYGPGNSQSAHKAIGWVTRADADRLLSIKEPSDRVAAFRSLHDVVI